MLILPYLQEVLKKSSDYRSVLATHVKRSGRVPPLEQDKKKILGI